MTDTVTQSRKASSYVVPVLISGALGAGLALLLTPKSGKDMRSDIKRYAARKGSSTDVSTGAETLYGQGQESVSAGTAPAETIAASGQEAAGEYAGNNTKSLLIPILVSSAVGAAIALMFAPKPGNEVWEDIKDLASSSWDKMTSAYEEAKGSAKEAAETATEKVKQAA